MQPLEPPKIAAVEVASAQPTEADSMAIAHLNVQADKSLPQVAYVVKINLKAKPQVTSSAWALYVSNVLIPKYWEYEDGIYFTVLDPQFFADHKGQRLRFSQDGKKFHDTGMKLPGPPAAAAQATVLKSSAKAKPKSIAKAKSRAKAKSKSKRKAAP
jgi:hypothetical protein